MTSTLLLRPPLVLMLSALLLQLCGIIDPSEARTSDELRLRLSDGSPIVGRYLRSHDGHGIRAFMGVPYAEPPLNDLRFRVSMLLLRERTD